MLLFSTLKADILQYYVNNWLVSGLNASNGFLAEIGSFLGMYFTVVTLNIGTAS